MREPSEEAPGDGAPRATAQEAASGGDALAFEAPADPRLEAVVREIGRVVQRMAERTRDDEAYLPHPLAVAMAEAVRGGNLTEGDGSFGGHEAGYQVMMGKRNGHFALLEVMNLGSGKLLAPEVVLRLLHGHEVLAQWPGDAVPREAALGVLAGLLGIDDDSSRLLLDKAFPVGPERIGPSKEGPGSAGPAQADAAHAGEAIDKVALLGLVERMPA